jgi:hypothetical protein
MATGRPCIAGGLRRGGQSCTEGSTVRIAFRLGTLGMAVLAIRFVIIAEAIDPMTNTRRPPFGPDPGCRQMRARMDKP